MRKIMFFYNMEIANYWFKRTVEFFQDIEFKVGIDNKELTIKVPNEDNTILVYRSMSERDLVVVGNRHNVKVYYPQNDFERDFQNTLQEIVNYSSETDGPVAKLIIVKNDEKRKLCACSKCRGYIASPSNGNVYKHCYNCGAKFDTPVSAKTIRELKQN